MPQFAALDVVMQGAEADATDELPTMPGQPYVPKFAEPWFGCLVIAATCMPPRKDCDVVVKQYEVAAGSIMLGKTKGQHRSGSTSNPNSKQVAAQKESDARVCAPSTKEQNAAYAEIFAGLQGSTVLIPVDGDGNSLEEYLKVEFVKEAKESRTNMQLQAAFEKKNGYTYSGQNMRLGGVFTVTGQMPPSLPGFYIEMQNQYEQTDDLGADTIKYCRMYFMATRLPANAYSQAQMERWPAGEKEEFLGLLALRTPVVHFGILKKGLWDVWDDNTSGHWNMPGTISGDTLLFCGTDVADKNDAEKCSMLFPDVMSAEPQEPQEPQEMDLSYRLLNPWQSAGASQAMCTGVVTQTGSHGEVRMEPNTGESLFADCDPNNVTAVFFGLQLKILQDTT